MLDRQSESFPHFLGAEAVAHQVGRLDYEFFALVAFGRLALRDYYPQLTQAERDQREEFVVEASYLMRDRFRSEEVWETLGLPVEQCVEYVDSSPDMREFQSRLFSRIVPTIKNIGLWGPKIRRAYSNMGVMAFADLDSEQMMENDEKVAQEFDARMGRTANA